MRRFAVPGLITVIAVALLVVLAIGISDQSSGTSISALVQRGDYPVAPNSHMAMTVLGGGHDTETLAAMRGRFVLINVFASWCEPCQAEAPAVAEAQSTLAAANGTVLGVAYQDNAGDDVSFMKQYHLRYPVWTDASGNFAHAYGVTGVPQSYLVDPAGKIVWTTEQPITDSWVRNSLPKLLQEHA